MARLNESQLAEAMAKPWRNTPKAISNQSSFEFEIPGRMPGLNDYDAQHLHLQAAGLLKKKWTKTVALLAKESAKGCQYQTIHADIQWIEPNKRRDKDNIAFAKKFIFDGLVSAGIIPNDGWANIAGWTERFEVDARNPRVVVTVINIEG